MKKNYPAFTLVELLVVIAIIAVLLAVLIPVLARSRQITYRIVCLNNLRQLGFASEAYTQSYKYYPVCTSTTKTWDDFLANPDIAKSEMLGVPVSLLPFYKNKKVYDCPVLAKLSCDISYCYNWLAGRKLNDEVAFASVSPSYIPLPEEQKENFRLLSPDRVKSPDTFVLMYDQPIKPQDAVIGAIDPYKDIDPDDYNDTGAKQGHLWKYEGTIDALGPHNDSDDILFADGHVKSHKNEKWPNPSISRNPD
jgi:prepilin-type N-terminal cleavage/methylation domain-containing protein/prepilin-type processing-associated H-X9-DG protein